MEINGLTFVETCCACPEQYDVKDENNKTVGYVRLRWGTLTCECPDVGGELVYEADVGDGLTGTFDSEDDRVSYLSAIAEVINKRIEEES